jgi:hypothetical protein
MATTFMEAHGVVSDDYDTLVAHIKMFKEEVVGVVPQHVSNHIQILIISHSFRPLTIYTV